MKYVPFLLRLSFVGAIFFLFAPRISSAASFLGETPQGLVELKEYRNPVYVFIPPGHDKSVYNTMVLLVPDSRVSPDKMVQEWLSVAKKKNLIIAVPEVQMPRDDVPYQADKFLLNLKKDLVNRYHIGRTYLVGKGEGAHYAAYLSTQHPEEFAGAGLLDGSWAGAFEKLTRLSVRPSGQLPFFISLYDPDAELMKQTEERAYRFTAKGYPVYLEKFSKDEKADWVDIRMRMIDWLQKKAEIQEQAKVKAGKTKKEKISKWLGEYLSSPAHH